MTEQFTGTLVVLRHAQSNPEDGHLTAVGRKQAEKFASSKFLKSVNHSHTQLLTGPAHRLVETTRIISDITAIGYSVLSRLSLETSTRNLPNPSPPYDERETFLEVLSVLKPSTRLAIIVAHSEMMNDLVFLHKDGKLLNENFKNMTGYRIDQKGQFEIIS